MFFKSLVSSDLPGQDGKFEYPRASPEYETSCFLAGKPQLNPEQLLICMRIIKGSCHHSSFTPVAESPVWPPRVSPLSVHTFCSHSKRWSLFSFPLTLVWPCDLLCSTERGREDILGLLSLVLTLESSASCFLEGRCQAVEKPSWMMNDEKPHGGERA